MKSKAARTASPLRSPRRASPLTGAISACLVVGLAAGCGTRAPSDEALMTAAISGADAAEREVAAVTLARRAANELRHTPPEKLAGFLGSSANVGRLRTLLDRRDDPGVQAAAARGLGEMRDVESLQKIIALIDSGSPLVRLRAAQATGGLIGMTFQFDPNGPAADRARVTKAYREQYEMLLGKKAKNREQLIRLLGPEGLKEPLAGPEEQVQQPAG
ncbi:MAG: HEAT repeat domain-containing protein [Planctomycetes bacterium]|nr:HEAT repeat domain-containing protein [Planctomycetota bacterium]